MQDLKRLPFTSADSDRRERRIMILSFLGLLLCAVVLLNESAFELLFGTTEENQKSPVVGHITQLQNDLRHRSNQSFGWGKAKLNKNIHVGDSLFTGSHSQAKVQLATGSSINLDQNSLVRFSSVDGIEIPNLALGNFQLNVDGKLKVAIDGEVTEIDGQNSKIQVVVSPHHKTVFKVIAGTATTTSLKKFLPFEKLDSYLSKMIGPPQLAKPNTPFEEPKPHTWTLYDFYTREELSLRPRPQTLKYYVPTQYQVADPPKLLDLRGRPVRSSLNRQIALEGRLSSSSPFVVLEISRDPLFSPETTVAQWRRPGAWKFLVSEEGFYYFRARGVDARQNVSELSPSSSLQIKHPNQPQIPLRLAEAPVEVKVEIPPALAQLPAVERSPSSELDGSLSLSGYFDVTRFQNRMYPSSKLTLEGSAFTMYSQDQIANEQPNPTALLVGLRWLKWWDQTGFEGSLRSKLTDVNSTPDTSVSPLIVEGKMKYRWTLPWNLFSDYQSSELAVIGGYEFYKNSGAGLFSKGYSLIKSGFSLAFPLLSRWDTGGELLYGRGFESSQKYEISGYLNYYWNLNLSIGAGYRVHLFEAGNEGTTPLGILPYREGFGEGYSVLRWHY